MSKFPVKVVLRLKPPDDLAGNQKVYEVEAKSNESVDFTRRSDNHSIICKSIESSSNSAISRVLARMLQPLPTSKESTFHFDFIHDIHPTCSHLHPSNESVFTSVRRCMDKLWEGYDIMFIALGMHQLSDSGGKSHTMFGNVEEKSPTADGFVHHAIKDIFTNKQDSDTVASSFSSSDELSQEFLGDVNRPCIDTPTNERALSFVSEQLQMARKESQTMFSFRVKQSTCESTVSFVDTVGRNKSEEKSLIREVKILANHCKTHVCVLATIPTPSKDDTDLEFLERIQELRHMETLPICKLQDNSYERTEIQKSSSHPELGHLITIHQAWPEVISILEYHLKLKYKRMKESDSFVLDKYLDMRSADIVKTLKRHEDYFIGEDDLKVYAHGKYGWVGRVGKEYSPISGKRHSRNRTNPNLQSMPGRKKEKAKSATKPVKYRPKKAGILNSSCGRAGTNLQSTPGRKKEKIKFAAKPVFESSPKEVAAVSPPMQTEIQKSSSHPKLGHLITIHKAWPEVISILEYHLKLKHKIIKGSHNFVLDKYAGMRSADIVKTLKRHEDYFIGEDDLKVYAHDKYGWVGPIGKEYQPLLIGGIEESRVSRKRIAVTKELTDEQFQKFVIIDHDDHEEYRYRTKTYEKKKKRPYNISNKKKKKIAKIYTSWNKEEQRMDGTTGKKVPVVTKARCTRKKAASKPKSGAPIEIKARGTRKKAEAKTITSSIKEENRSFSMKRNEALCKDTLSTIDILEDKIHYIKKMIEEGGDKERYGDRLCRLNDALHRKYNQL